MFRSAFGIPCTTWMAATLDGMVEPAGAVFEAKFMLPWTFTEEAAAEKHMAQLQHNMWVVTARTSVLSIITGGGKWVEIKIYADPLYQHLLFTAERKFWRCVQSGEPPLCSTSKLRKPRLEAVSRRHGISMPGPSLPRRLSRPEQPTEHEIAKAGLRSLYRRTLSEASGHGIRPSGPSPGAISFDILAGEGCDASIQ